LSGSPRPSQLAPLAGEARAASHIATKAVAAAGSTDVLVVANGGRGDVSCWGGLLSLGASRRGIRGVIVDGACRDVDEAGELGFPVFARATTPLRPGAACARSQPVSRSVSGR